MNDEIAETSKLKTEIVVYYIFKFKFLFYIYYFYILYIFYSLTNKYLCFKKFCYIKNNISKYR